MDVGGSKAVAARMAREAAEQARRAEIMNKIRELEREKEECVSLRTGFEGKKLREKGISAAYYKAAMSGNERRADDTLIPSDALQVKNMSGIEQPLEEMCPYIYETAVSPHLAAKLEGNPISMECVLKNFNHVCQKYDYVTIEGSGGIVCPLRFA